MRREEQLATLKSVFDETQIEALMTAFGAEKITKDKVDEAFDKFWRWYPDRKTQDTNKKAAWDKFRKIVASGVDPDALAHTAKNYRAECKRVGQDPEFIPMRSTFLGDQKGRWQQHMPKGEEHKWELRPKIAPGVVFHAGQQNWWAKISLRLLAEFGEKTYRSYFDKLALSECKGDRITLLAESSFMAKKISMEYGNRLSDIAGCPVRVVA